MRQFKYIKFLFLKLVAKLCQFVCMYVIIFLKFDIQSLKHTSSAGGLPVKISVFIFIICQIPLSNADEHFSFVLEKVA